MFHTWCLLTLLRYLAVKGQRSLKKDWVLVVHSGELGEILACADQKLPGYYYFVWSVQETDLGCDCHMLFQDMLIKTGCIFRDILAQSEEMRNDSWTSRSFAVGRICSQRMHRLDGCELRLTYFNLSRSELDVIDGFAGKTFEGAWITNLLALQCSLLKII